MKKKNPKKKKKKDEAGDWFVRLTIEERNHLYRMLLGWHMCHQKGDGWSAEFDAGANAFNTAIECLFDAIKHIEKKTGKTFPESPVKRMLEGGWTHLDLKTRDRLFTFCDLPSVARQLSFALLRVSAWFPKAVEIVRVLKDIDGDDVLLRFTGAEATGKTDATSYEALIGAVEAVTRFRHLFHVALRVAGLVVAKTACSDDVDGAGEESASKARIPEYMESHFDAVSVAPHILDGGEGPLTASLHDLVERLDAMTETVEARFDTATVAIASWERKRGSAGPAPSAGTTR